MPKFRKKPVVIEAECFTTNNEIGSPMMDRLVNWMNQGRDRMQAWHNGTDIYIETSEGTMCADVGDWIIKGTAGECYPVKDSIFQEIYEPVEDSEEIDFKWPELKAGPPIPAKLGETRMRPAFSIDPDEF